MKKFLSLRPVRFVTDVVQVFLNRNSMSAAAGLAYFLLLTVFPLLIVTSSVLAMADLNVLYVMNLVQGFLPGQAAGLVGDYLNYIIDNRSTPLLVAGVVMTITFSAAAFRILLRTSSSIYRRPPASGVWVMVGSFLFSMAFLVIIYASVLVILTGSWFFATVERVLHITILVFHWQWLRFVILFCLLLGFLCLFYRATAPRGKPRPPVLTGAFLTAVLLVGASVMFSAFISFSSRYSLVYGSLASIIILLVWLYLCGNVFILGNVFNYVWYSHKKERLEGAAAPRPL